MAERIRVQKALSAAGLMSRRAAEEAIAAGRVAIDGRTAILGDRCDPDAEVVTLDGAPIPLAEALETYLLNKPAGVISAASDPHGRSTVVDLIDSEARLYPVGRLDADSEGLILVSNDGELTNRVTHPRFGMTKTYLAEVEGRVTRRTTTALVDGVELDDGPASALSARLVETHGDMSLVELVMGEGRNREVRRMFDSVGHPVSRLVRTAIGSLVDSNLKPGHSRRLTASEVTDLLKDFADTVSDVD